MLVLHPHFHPRRTGVTSHTESIVRALNGKTEARVQGQALAADLPKISWRELLKRTKTEDVVWHAHRNNEFLVGLCLRLLRPRLKLVLTRHGGRKPGAFSRLLASFAGALVVLNEEATSHFPEPTHLVPHGVDTERFLPPPQRDDAWKALGLPGHRGMGVVGRIRQEKGQGDFVEAVAPLLPSHPEWTPVLVGRAEAGESPWVEALVARTQGRLCLVSEQEDIRPWYRGLSIVVVASHSESFGLVLLEAMASGCCVVASSLPHVPQIIEDNVTGFLFSPGDAAALGTKLSTLMKKPALVHEVGLRAARRVREHFGIEHEAMALFNLYSSLFKPS